VVRAAVISDVHGNLAALEAVVESALETSDVIWCLGDVVGYGPRPNECLALVREHCSIVLAGNHDLAAVGIVDAVTFSRDAGRAVRWTREVLAADHEAYLRTLRPLAEYGEVGLYHGSPRDPVWEYVLDAAVAQEVLEAADHRVILCGHTHGAVAAFLETGRLHGGRVGDGRRLDLRDRDRILLNPGAVGQPRDGDPRAAWMVLTVDADGTATNAEFHRTSYDIGRTQVEILEAGLPERLADRLSFGS